MVPICYLPPIASPKRMLSTPHDPGGKSGEGGSSNEKRRQLITKIAASVEQSDGVPPMKRDGQLVLTITQREAICENMDDDEIAGCHKAISLEEALRKCRTYGWIGNSCKCQRDSDGHEHDDSESIRWKKTAMRSCEDAERR